MRNKLLEKIKEIINKDNGISIRQISAYDTKVYILYIQQITDRERLSNDIIKPIIHYKGKDSLTLEKLSRSVLYIDDILIDNDKEKIIDYILMGKSIIILADEEKYILANTLKSKKRDIKAPEIETTLRGAKDSFTENINDNLSLIRYRIKDPSLKIDKYTVGRRSKTNVAVVYVKDIVNPQYISQVKEKIESIDVDGVFESGYIQKYLFNSAFSIFPRSGIVERSDSACANIVEGKICIIVEGSNLAVVVPKTIVEFIDTADDHYDSIYLALFSKSIRFLCLMISLTLSSIYVAIVSFHPSVLPPQYILVLATARATVPFNSLIEALVMEGVAEVLREASIRLPKQIGPAIGIVGTIVIGQAAVIAGLVSPLMVIIVSLSIMCSFATGDYTLTNAIRVLKFMILFSTGVLGIFGFVMSITMILINICSINTLGTSYVAPISPFNLRDFKNYLFSDITLAKKRPKFLNTKDKTRQ